MPATTRHAGAPPAAQGFVALHAQLKGYEGFCAEVVAKHAPAIHTLPPHAATLLSAYLSALGHHQLVVAALGQLVPLSIAAEAAEGRAPLAADIVE